MVDTAPPRFGADDVLVRVYAAALNPYDWHIVCGDPLVARLMGGVGLRRPKDRVAGVDAHDSVFRPVTILDQPRPSRGYGPDGPQRLVRRNGRPCRSGAGAVRDRLVVLPKDGGREKREADVPLIQVKVIENVFTAEQKQQIVRRLTDAMVEIEGENMRPVTWCVVDEVRSGDWGIAGNPLSTQDVKALAAGVGAH